MRQAVYWVAIELGLVAVAALVERALGLMPPAGGRRGWAST